VEPRRLRVMVVDDEYLCRWATHQILARWGHEVQEAASGEAALRMVERWNPDAALLDIGLPGMNGLEVLATIRRCRPIVRAIIMTANATLETAIAAIRGGAVDYLTKPLDPGELESALARVKMRSRGAVANLVA
jgi:DNA-binding NtrC family response regulator